MRAGFDGIQPQQRPGRGKRHDLLQPRAIRDAYFHGAGTQLIQIQQWVAGAVDGFSPVDTPATADGAGNRRRKTIAGGMAKAREDAPLAVARQGRRQGPRIGKDNG
ncbi:hypothetical protein D3C72_1935750 [compost metagenome]